MDTDGNLVSKCLENFVTSGTNVKRKLEDDFRDYTSGEQFVKDRKQTTLMQLIPLYKQMYLKLNIFDRKTLDLLFEKLSQENPECENRISEFLKFEDSINGFLRQLDASLNNVEEESQLQVGDNFPNNIVLRRVADHKQQVDNVTSNSEVLFGEGGGWRHCIVVLLRHFAWLPWRKHVDELEMVKDELSDESCAVVVVTFGDRDGALKWQEETGCTYPLVMDPERNIYKLLGLTRSFEKANNTSALSFYGAALASGETPPHHFDNDDYQQMGGNIVLRRDDDQQATVTYIHRSQTSADRPTVPFLIKHVTRLNNQ